MGQPDHTRIALGVLGATAVAVVAYLLAKTFSNQGKSKKKQNASGDDEVSQEKFVSSVAAALKKQIPPELYGEEKDDQDSEYSPAGRKYSGGNGNRQEHEGENGQGQTSFIVIDSNDNAEVTNGEGHHPKKSDRSSDESSYDVIEDERFEENAEEEEEDESEDKDRDKNDNVPADLDKEECGQPGQESFMDPNETSMVVIEDSDRSAVSSFYASAEENLGLESSGKSADTEEGIQKESAEGEGSRLEEEETLMFEGEGKSTTAEEEFEAQEPDETGQDRKPEQEDTGKSMPSYASVVKDHGKQEELSPAEKPMPISQSSPKSQEKLKIIAVTDAVVGASASPSKEMSPVAEPVESDMELSFTEITDVLTSCQNKPMVATKADINKLVVLLRRKNPELHSTVLTCLVRVAAFTQNINNLRESGCPEEISLQVRENCEEIRKGRYEAESILNSLCQVLSNLTLDPKTQALLGDTVPALIDVILLESVTDYLRLAALRPLINLSSDTTYHSQYVRVIQELYNLLDFASQTTKIQSLKILVNLSLDAEIVPHLLAAKAPACLLDLLDRPTSTDIILRTVTMLANIVAAMQAEDMSVSSLPIQDKAESPEMLFTALTSEARVATLRSKVFRLTRHDTEDVCYQASKLHKSLSESVE